MKKLFAIIALLAAIAGGVYVSARLGVAPVVDLLDRAELSEPLGLQEGVVSSQFAAGESVADVCGYAYGFLTPDQAELYVGLYHAAQARLGSFTLFVDDLNDIEPALGAMLDDHPEFFWLSGACSYSRRYGSKRCTLELDFSVPAEEIDAFQGQIDARVSEFLAGLGEQASDYEKVKAAYEYVINLTDYGYDSPRNQNMASVFVDRISVCAGYARAYQYLLQKAGVPCAFIHGSVGGGSEEHAWNLVAIEGTYSYVDPTWGDPTYTGPRGEPSGSTLNYDYLCLTREEMERDGHRAELGDALPDAADTRWDFYRLIGGYYEYYDFDTVNQALAWYIGQGYTEAAFKFATDEAYAAAYADLEDRAFVRGAFQDLAISRGETVSSHQYAGNSNLRIIHFFWE